MSFWTKKHFKDKDIEQFVLTPSLIRTNCHDCFNFISGGTACDVKREEFKNKYIKYFKKNSLNVLSSGIRDEHMIGECVSNLCQNYSKKLYPKKYIDQINKVHPPIENPFKKGEYELFD